MSQTKKLFIVAVVFLAIASMAFVSGCGGSKANVASSEASGKSVAEETVAAEETAPATKEIAAESKVKGTIYETDKFSILQPDGWETEDLSAEGSVGVAIMKDKDVMNLSVLVDVPDAATVSKEQVELLVKGLNGTALEEVTMFGIKFFKTSYTLEGSDTTIFYGDRNGDVVIIAMAGKDHQNNVEIKAMLDSIKFK